jgi:hypothetical protein
MAYRKLSDLWRDEFKERTLAGLATLAPLLLSAEGQGKSGLDKDTPAKVAKVAKVTENFSGFSRFSTPTLVQP